MREKVNTATKLEHLYIGEENTLKHSTGSVTSLMTVN